jgi:hypothetical protein
MLVLFAIIVVLCCLFWPQPWQRGPQPKPLSDRERRQRREREEAERLRQEQARIQWLADADQRRADAQLWLDTLAKEGVDAAMRLPNQPRGATRY